MWIKPVVSVCRFLREHCVLFTILTCAVLLMAAVAPVLAQGPPPPPPPPTPPPGAGAPIGGEFLIAPAVVGYVVIKLRQWRMGAGAHREAICNGEE